MKQEARDRFGVDPEDPGRGKHLWMMIGMWKITDPTKVLDPTATFHLDRENLLTLQGPGCYKCEKVWEPSLENRWCNGSMR